MRPEDSCVRQIYASMAQEKAFLDTVLAENEPTRQTKSSGPVDIYVPKVDASVSDAAVLAYEDEIEGLKREIEAMDASTKRKVQALEIQNAAAYETSASEWSAVVATTMQKMQQTEDAFFSARDAAEAKIYEDVQEIERLRALKVARVNENELFQSPQEAPAVRLRRMQVTSTVTRQMVPPRYLRQADQMLGWLCVCDIAKKHVSGGFFAEDLTDSTGPEFLQRASKPCLQALHHALRFLPVGRWPEARQAIARILQTIDA